MKFRLIAAALIVVVIVTTILGYRWQPDVARIADAGKPIELTLRPTRKVGNVHELHVEGRGKITGEADISLVLNGEPYETVRLNGAVHFTWREEWHASEAVVRYTPVSPAKGAIKLLYRFTGS